MMLIPHDPSGCRSVHTHTHALKRDAGASQEGQMARVIGDALAKRQRLEPGRGVLLPMSAKDRGFRGLNLVGDQRETLVDRGYDMDGDLCKQRARCLRCGFNVATTALCLICDHLNIQRGAVYAGLFPSV